MLNKTQLHNRLFSQIALMSLISILILACKDSKTTGIPSCVKDVPEGMIWVPSKQFLQGSKAGDDLAMQREQPAHLVEVDGFFIDKTEVTNLQFMAFVEETGYITLAERPLDWEELKTQLLPGASRPHDSILAPGSLVFNRNAKVGDNLNNYLAWWTWQVGADWKHPEGPKSSLEGREHHPVVHIAYEDAIAYCKWKNRRLPTEAEWEAAALGTYDNSIFTWGDDLEPLHQYANTWQGKFPNINTSSDGYKGLAPVGSYAPNSIGLYDMLGNVWELTNDYFDMHYYQKLLINDLQKNPKGPKELKQNDNAYKYERVIKGGSFLCHKSYCASFRISARMGNAEKSSSDHVGFRTVASCDMLSN